MRIEAHLLHWQEKDILPYVIRHYKSFCDEIIIHDNHSKDGSAEMAKELGCTIIPFGSDFFDDGINMDVKNSCWKGSNADYCVVADFDELLFITPRFKEAIHFNEDGKVSHIEDLGQVGMKEWLSYQKEADITILKTIGWQIMSDEWPVHDLTEITNGFEFSNYAKTICFSPKHITDIGFGPGAHESNPKGLVQWSESPLYVLHYKHIGGVQRTIDRYRVLQKRLSKNNRRQGWGCHYAQSPARLRQEWNERMKLSRPLI